MLAVPSLLGSSSQLATQRRRAAPVVAADRRLLFEGGRLRTQPGLLALAGTETSLVVPEQPPVQPTGSISITLGTGSAMMGGVSLTTVTALFGVTGTIYSIEAKGLEQFMQQSVIFLETSNVAPEPRMERPAQEPDAALPFLVIARRLVETEQLTAARRMFDAAPTDVLSDPLVSRLRSVLAPPVVKQVPKRDTDRSAEYEWLRSQGHRHRGHWIALAGGTLLAEAATLRDLREALKPLNLPHPPFLHRIAD